MKVCHEHCMTLVDDHVSIDTKICSTCTQCIAICPQQALSWDKVPPAAFVKTLLPSPEQLAELFEERRSIRDFKKDRVSRELLAEIVSLGIDAPTNNYSLKAVVVDDEEIIKALDRVVVKFSGLIYNSFFKSKLIFNLIRVFTPAIKETDKVKMEKVIERGQNFRTFPAAMVFIVGDRRVALSESSAQYALANMMYYTQAKGLACCLFGPGQLLLDRNKTARKLLKLDKDEHILGTLNLGYAAVNFRNKVKGKTLDIRFA